MKSVLVLIVCCGILDAQTAGSVLTHALPFYSQHVFVDSVGDTYSAGVSSGAVTATPGAAQPQSNGATICGIALTVVCPNAYITKADLSGNLVLATFFGGRFTTTGNAITADAAGNIYVVGQVGDLPVTANAAIATQPPGGITYAAKFSADGTKIVYATYLPAAIRPIPVVLVADAHGNLYVGGTTNGNQAVVLKIGGDGSAIQYTNVLASDGEVTALAVDPDGNLLVAGNVGGSDLPVTAGALQAKLPTGISGGISGFAVRLDPAGDVLAGTYLGGAIGETVSSLATDAAGNIYVAGQTNSPDFPTSANSFQAAAMIPLWGSTLRSGGGSEGFLVKMTPNAGSRAYSTFIPGSGLTAMAVSAAGDVYITGTSFSGFPVTGSAPRPCMAAGEDAYVAHLSASGALLDASYLGLQNALPLGMALASDGSVFIAQNGPLAQLRFGGAGWSVPPCITPDVLNAASQTSSVVPGEMVTLVGWGIGPQTGVAYQPGPQGQIPTSAGGVEVFFDGVAAPVLYAQSQQVNAEVPFSVSGTTVVTLRYQGMTFGPFTRTVLPVDPEIFRTQPGVSAQALALNQDNTLNGPSNPAARGSVIYFYGTGFGPTSPGCTAGGLNVPAAASLVLDGLLANGLSLGTQEIVAPIAPVLYAGSAPALPCGVVQLNMLAPDQAAPGLYEIFLRAGTTTNAALSTIYVK